MSTPAKPKKNLEAIVALKAVKASKEEAQEAVYQASRLTENPETPAEARSLIAWYRNELLYRPEDTARREVLMAGLAAAAAPFV